MSDPKNDRRWIAGEPRVFTDDDGRPRLDRLPIDASPPPLPPVWPGGVPRFPVDFRFYLTALRAELAHLIDRLKAYRSLNEGGVSTDAQWRMVKAMAVDSWGFARAARQYHADLLRTIGGPSELTGSIGAVAKIGLDAIVADLREMAFGRSPDDFAGLASAPAMVRDLEAAYGFLPDVRFNLDIPSESVDAPASTGPEAPADTPDATAPVPREAPAEVVSIEVSPVAPAERPKTKAKPRGRYDSVDAEATKFLSADPQLTNIQIAAMIGCHPRTLSGKKRDKKTGEMVPRCPRFLAARQTLKDRRLDYQSAYANQDGGRHRG